MSIDARLNELGLTMRIVQFTLATLVLTCLMALPGYTQTGMPLDSRYLAISAASKEGFDAIRTVKFWDGRQLIGIWDNQPFSMEVTSSYPDDPLEIYIALSDGQLYDVTKEAMDYQCLYFVPIYGLVIGKYPEGHYGTLNFFINSAWKEPTYLPERPELLMPEVEDDPEMQELIERWWKCEVEEREKRRDEAREAARIRDKGE